MVAKILFWDQSYKVNSHNNNRDFYVYYNYRHWFTEKREAGRTDICNVDLKFKKEDINH